MKEFVTMLLGNTSTVTFLGYLFFAILGVFLSLLTSTTKRDIQSPYTPFHFSWRFLYQDNAKRLYAGVILLFIALRFTPQIFGVTLNEFWALLIGLTSDQLMQYIKDKTNLLTKKDK